jgi:putative transposase
MAQSLASILIHLVFSTKHRQPLIKPEVEANLHAYLATVFRNHQCPPLLVGGMTDHIHALFSLHRTRTLAEIDEEVKKSSSK